MYCMPVPSMTLVGLQSDLRLLNHLQARDSLYKTKLWTTLSIPLRHCDFETSNTTAAYFDFRTA